MSLIGDAISTAANLGAVARELAGIRSALERLARVAELELAAKRGGDGTSFGWGCGPWPVGRGEDGPPEPARKPTTAPWFGSGPLPGQFDPASDIQDGEDKAPGPHDPGVLAQSDEDFARMEAQELRRLRAGAAVPEAIE